MKKTNETRKRVATFDRCQDAMRRGRKVGRSGRRSTWRGNKAILVRSSEVKDQKDEVIKEDRKKYRKEKE